MDSRLTRGRVFAKKPLLLKDFLVDDFGSCSSNGFMSFPRRQCCSSVPFLTEFDLKNRKVKKRLSFNESALSAFRSVFAAVKRLPFRRGGLRSPEKKKKKLKYDSFLPRSGFWKRKPARKEIKRWKSFDQLLREESYPSSRSYRWPATVVRFAEATALAAEECSSGDASAEGILGGTVAGDGNDVVEVVGTNDDVLVESTAASEGSVSTNSPTNPKEKQWLPSEEKEQFSPLSVLDCPFDDDDEVSSPFQRRLARMEGTKKELMKKIHMFESLAKLEPLNLATRFTTKLDRDNESSSCAVDEKSTSDVEERCEEDVQAEMNNEGRSSVEGKAMELLLQIKGALQPSYNDLKPNHDSFLLDFFKERLVSDQGVRPAFDERILEEASDWLNGRGPGEKALNWEVEKSREGYLKDMEKGEWKTLDQETKEVAFMLETEVFYALLDELFEDII